MERKLIVDWVPSCDLEDSSAREVSLLWAPNQFYSSMVLLLMLSRCLFCAEPRSPQKSMEAAQGKHTWHQMVAWFISCKYFCAAIWRNFHHRGQMVYSSLEALEIGEFRAKFLLQNMHAKTMFLISAFAWECKLQWLSLPVRSWNYVVQIAQNLTHLQHHPASFSCQR